MKMPTVRRQSQRKNVLGARDLDSLPDPQLIVDVTGRAATRARFLDAHDISIPVCRPVAERVRPADAIGQQKVDMRSRLKGREFNVIGWHELNADRVQG